MMTTVPISALTKANAIQAKLSVNSASTSKVSGVTAPADSVRAISTLPKIAMSAASPKANRRGKTRERDASRTNLRRLVRSNSSRRCVGIDTGVSVGMPGSETVGAPSGAIVGPKPSIGITMCRPGAGQET
jgi:hypothetical protein